MYYKVKLNLKKTVPSINDLRELNNIAENLIKEETDDEAHFVISNINFLNVEFLGVTHVNYEFKGNSVDQIIDRYCDLCKLTVDSFQIEQLTYQKFDNEIRNYTTKSKTKELFFNLEQILNSYDSYEFHYIKYMEYIVDKTEDKEILEYSSSFRREKKRIKANQQNRFLGHPVHYKFVGDNLKNALICAKSLTYELHERNRLIYPYLTRYFLFREPNDLSMVNLQDITMSIGGSCLIDLSDSIYAEYTNAQVENYIRMIADLVRKHRNQILFMFYSNNKDGRVIRMLDVNLSDVTFSLIDENLIARETAIERIVENLEELDLDTNLVNEILPMNSLFKAKDVDDYFNKWYDQYLKLNVYTQYQNMETDIADNPISINTSGLEELQSMIGLHEIKEMVINYISYQEAKEMYAQNGIQLPKVAQHMVFKGAPGTAKTSVARIIGKIMKEHRLLSVGDFYEVSRSELVDKYVGWTARNVKNIFRKAAGSVLFIDEAYSLLDSRNNDHSYGDEAIATIVQEMENRRDDFIVIFAGYPKEMDEFLSKNPGLSSRVGFQFDFKNYSNTELIEIAQKIASDLGFSINQDALELIKNSLNQITKQSDFGNGRTMRTIIEKAILKHSVSMLSLKTFDRSLTELYADDFEINIYDTQNYLNFRNLKTGVH